LELGVGWRTSVRREGCWIMGEGSKRVGRNGRQDSISRWEMRWMGRK